MVSRVHLWGSVFLTASSVSPALAQEAPLALSTITVVDSHDDDTVTDVVTSDQVAARQPTTLNELFTLTPDVQVSGANRTTAQKVYVRGIEETMLNVSIDGARQGGTMYAHSGNTGFDPQMLKQVEVEAGTGSALSGPGALGGAIRYETKDPEDLLLPGQTNGVMLRFSAQTNGERLNPALAFYGTPTEKFGYVVYGAKAWAKDYKDGNGDAVADTDSEPLDTLVKLRFRPTEDQEIEFSNIYRRDNGFRGYRSNFGIPSWIPDSIPEKQELGFLSTSLKYHYGAADNPYVDLTISGYDTRSRLKRDIETPLTSEWFTRGLDIRNRSKFDALALTYGYDYTWTRSKGKGGGAEGEETGDNNGLYLQGDYQLSSQWLLSAGLRYDRASLDDLAGNKYESSRVSPSASVRYEPLDGLALFASWGQAFRGPQPVDGMTLIAPLGLGADTDTSLDGERARTAQAGFSYDRDGWRAGLTAFSTRIENKIGFWRGPTVPWVRWDDGTIDSKGVTARLGRDWGAFSADFAYAHTDVEYNGEPVSPSDWLSGITAPGDKLILALGYAMPAQALQFGWTSTFQMKQTDLPDDFAMDELPGYDVHDISMVWTPAMNQSYMVALTNIFDKQYIDQSTAYYGADGWTNLYEMGRSLRFAATVRF